MNKKNLKKTSKTLSKLSLYMQATPDDGIW